MSKSIFGNLLGAAARALDADDAKRLTDIGLKLLTKKLMTTMPDGMSEAERKLMEKRVRAELNSAFDSVRHKFTRVAKNQPIDVDRLKVLAACDTLNVPRPKPGRPVDLAKAKRHQRQAVRAYHPDMNGGDQKHRNEFEAAVKAYDVLEVYNESLVKKPIATPPTPTTTTQNEPPKEQ